MSDITLTTAAIQHIGQFLNNRGHGEGIRLAVRTNGCSGLSYVIEFIDEGTKQDGDTFVDFAEFRVAIDAKSLVYLLGTEVDYVKEGLNEGFKFNNPNEAGACGCGESFTV